MGILQSVQRLLVGYLPQLRGVNCSFFSKYVKTSERLVVVLGPEEYDKKRRVNQASTPLAIWRKHRRCPSTGSSP